MHVGLRQRRPSRPEQNLFINGGSIGGDVGEGFIIEVPSDECWMLQGVLSEKKVAARERWEISVD